MVLEKEQCQDFAQMIGRSLHRRSQMHRAKVLKRERDEREIERKYKRILFGLAGGGGGTLRLADGSSSSRLEISGDGARKNKIDIDWK